MGNTFGAGLFTNKAEADAMISRKVQRGRVNKHYFWGTAIRVPRGTKKVYAPRRQHYSANILTEEANMEQLEKFTDILEPCIIKRGIFGWHAHYCEPFHKGGIYIIEDGTMPLGMKGKPVIRST